jgi:hypothetical protein
MPYSAPAGRFAQNATPIGGGLGQTLDPAALNGFIDGLTEHETRLTAAETGSTALLMNVTSLRTSIDETWSTS